jgi:type IV pilus assembly protein PilW
MIPELTHYSIHNISYPTSNIQHPTSSKSGFTLVEIMVALGLSAVIAAAAFKALTAQQHVYIVQDQSVDLQQSLRAAVGMMVKELKLAGFDPSGRAGAGIVLADAASIHFTMDLNGNGDCKDGNEDVTYSLYVDKNGVTNLGRKSGAGSNQSIAQHVEGLEFWYAVENDGVTTGTHTPTDPAGISTIEINLLLKAQKSDKSFTDTTLHHTTHAEADPAVQVVDWGPYNDGFRRRFASTVVRCRNMEFK